ncbi:MAG: hypothetical protein GEV12_12290 [Micromonosporaceae bacterium]|nr:hypothetical protein [Micromonosporaceae bacterium]
MTRRVLVAATIGLLLGLALAGCGAGSDAATSATRGSIPGVDADDLGVAIRNARVPFAPEGYAAGADARVELSVINNGIEPVQLVDLDSPAAGSVSVVSAAPVAGTAPPAGDGPPNGGAGPQLLLAPGEAVTAVLQVAGLREPLDGTGSLPVVLTFDNGAGFTLNVPSAPPAEPLPREPAEPAEES